jgi:hypothetical protein
MQMILSGRSKWWHNACARTSRGAIVALHVAAAVPGLLGGLCWVVRWLLEPAWADALATTGLVLLGLALAGTGAGLVSRSAVWLRVLVAVAFPLLVWSVYAVVKGDSEGLLLDGVLGVVAVLGAGGLLLRERRSAARRTPRAGSHAR